MLWTTYTTRTTNYKIGYIGQLRIEIITEWECIHKKKTCY
jgi:hypothetical protein